MVPEHAASPIRFEAMLLRQIGDLRTELYSEIGKVRSDMQGMTRTYILGNVGLVFTVAAIAFGAARLV